MTKDSGQTCLGTCSYEAQGSQRAIQPKREGGREGIRTTNSKHYTLSLTMVS